VTSACPIGLEKEVIQFAGVLSRLSAPILFTGRFGIGKSSVALAVAAAAQCLTPQASLGCGQCTSCQAIASGSHPDILVIARGEKVKVEDADAIREHLNSFPLAKFRIAVIADCERLTNGAVNALLKTLEECPPMARVLLTTASPNDLLPTLRSRCISFTVPPIARELGVARVRELLGEGGKDVDACWNGSVGGTLQRALADYKTSYVDAQKVIQGDLEAAERLSKLGASGFELVENALNDSYRLGNDRASFEGRERRRDFMRRAKALARRGHVALNMRLTMEAIASYAEQEGKR
jgi:DNA polymerase III delta prime subunit